jgi:hypothetical protein
LAVALERGEIIEVGVRNFLFGFEKLSGEAGKTIENDEILLLITLRDSCKLRKARHVECLSFYG